MSRMAGKPGNAAWQCRCQLRAHPHGGANGFFETQQSTVCKESVEFNRIFITLATPILKQIVVDLNVRLYFIWNLTD